MISPRKYTNKKKKSSLYSTDVIIRFKSKLLNTSYTYVKNNKNDVRNYYNRNK